MIGLSNFFQKDFFDKSVNVVYYFQIVLYKGKGREMELAEKVAEILENEELTLEEPLITLLERERPGIFDGFSETQKKRFIQYAALNFFAITANTKIFNEILKNFKEVKGI